MKTSDKQDKLDARCDLILMIVAFITPLAVLPGLLGL